MARHQKLSLLRRRATRRWLQGELDRHMMTALQLRGLPTGSRQLHQVVRQRGQSLEELVAQLGKDAAVHHLLQGPSAAALRLAVADRTELIKNSVIRVHRLALSVKLESV